MQEQASSLELAEVGMVLASVSALQRAAALRRGPGGRAVAAEGLLLSHRC